jgi:hypothetical protein
MVTDVTRYQGSAAQISRLNINKHLYEIHIASSKKERKKMFYSFISGMGPFKLEVKMVDPFRVVFHDFLSENEIEWIVDYSKPRLSRTRMITKSNYEGEKVK